MIKRALALAVAAATLGIAPRALACSCALVPEAEYVRQADAILDGRAVDVRRGPGTAVVWTFDVEVVRKGSAADPQDIETEEQSAACGFPFEQGRRYRVYASRAEDGTLRSGLCDGTRPLDERTRDETAPRSRFRTADGAVLLAGDGVGGTAIDDLSGVARIVLTFSSTLVAPRTARATLSCASRRRCSWTAESPSVPGRYSVEARATDRAGNTERPGPAIVVVVT